MGPEISRNAIVSLASQNKNHREGLGGAGLGVMGRWGSFPDQQAPSETCHIDHGPSLPLFVLCFPQWTIPSEIEIVPPVPAHRTHEVKSNDSKVNRLQATESLWKFQFMSTSLLLQGYYYNIYLDYMEKTDLRLFYLQLLCQNHFEHITKLANHVEIGQWDGLKQGLRDFVVY